MQSSGLFFVFNAYAGAHILRCILWRGLRKVCLSFTSTYLAVAGSGEVSFLCVLVLSHVNAFTGGCVT
jgi:hypothetical protein